MGVFQNNLLAGAAAAASAGGGAFYDYQIEQSVRFEEDAGDKIARTPGSSGNRRTFTISFWLKRTVLSNSGNHMVIFGADAGSSNYFHLRLDNSNLFRIAAAGGTEYIYDPILRDTSGWGHYMIAYDNTQSTSTDRVKFYINGTQITDTSAASAPSQNYDTAVNQSGVEQELGILGYASNTSDFAGYMAEFIIIDGTAQAPTDLGESKNGVWIPKDPSGLTFGTNGVHLKFENASDLGNDSSGNNNDYSVTNMGADHQVLDSPTFGS
jgi:hypothetical protein